MELRAPNNVTLEPGHEGLTLRQWYNSVNTDETHVIYVKVPAGKDKGISKESSFMLELFIHVNQVSTLFGCLHSVVYVFSFQYKERLAEVKNNSDDDGTLKPITNTSKRAKKTQGQATSTKRGKGEL